MALQAYSFVTVAEVKTYLDISENTWDTTIEDLIDQCTKYIMNYCGGRTFLNSGSDVTEYLDGNDSNKILIRNWPIISVTSISYRSGGTYASPTFTAFDSANDYIRDDAKGIIYFGNLLKGRQNIKLVYQGGYANAAAVPDDLHLAVRKLVSKEFSRRKSQGVLNESVGGASATWSEALDPAIISILDNYRLVI